MATQAIFSGEEAQKKLEQLPKEVRDLIYSVQMTETIRKIGNAHHLFIDKIGTLEAETSFLMLGFTEPADFVSVLMERLPTDRATAEMLAKEVNDQLLVKIRTALMEMYPESHPGEKNSIPVSRGAIHDEITAPPVQPTLPPKVEQKINQAPTPVVQTPPSQPHLSAVDDALSAPQSTPAQTVDVPAPQVKPPAYTSDPYLESIE